MKSCPECNTEYEDDIVHCPEDGANLAELDELIGRSVGSYQVVKPLGKGGMGAVYMGQHPVIGSKVAIKFLHAQYATDQKIVDRFFNEARAVNVIGHDNILKIIDLNVTDDNRHYFVMEFLHGKPLQALIQPNVPVPLDITGPILLQVFEALQAAHDKKIIHRDLKPDNIYLISHKGRKNFVKVVDFGIAKLSAAHQAEGTGKTQTGMVMGTPAYMSPEQAGGQTNMIDGRSDVYSLGVMMFQMATGQLPFPGTSFGEVLIGHLQVPPPKPRDIVPGIPEEYEAIILKMLAKKQEDRFQSMREVHDAVAALMVKLGISAELPIDDAPPQNNQIIPVAARTQSQPGRRTSPPRNSSPGRSRSGQTNPPDATQMVGAGGPASLAPVAKSKGPMIAGVVLLLLALGGGGVGYMMYQDGQEQKRALAQRREEDKKRIALAEAEKQKQVEAQKDAKVQITILTQDATTHDPVVAVVQAKWPGGNATGKAPKVLEGVPKDKTVALHITAVGYRDLDKEIVASDDRNVPVELTPAPVVVATPTPTTTPSARPHPPRPHGNPTGVQPASTTVPGADNSEDTTLPVDFGDSK